MEQTFIKFMYVTFPSLEEAKRICTPLVEQKLAACVNIFPGSQTIYRWDNQIQEAQEVSVFIKTRDSNVGEIREHIKKLHPYEIPCIVDFDVTGGNPAFLHWIRTNA